MTLAGPLEPGYSIAFDQPNGLMRITVRGLWNAQNVAAFLNEADAIAWLAEPHPPTTD